MNPYCDLVSSISPAEFEMYCLKILSAYAESEKVTDFSITHNEKIEASDGVYQIDIYAEFVAMSVKFKVIVECKRYTSPIEREKITVLADKVRSLGANKGILMSTSGFQSGAIEYAKVHGISLIQIIDKRIMHVVASAKPKFTIQQMQFMKQSPPYYAFQYSGTISDFPDKKIYPTDFMEKELLEKINEQFK